MYEKINSHLITTHLLAAMMPHNNDACSKAQLSLVAGNTR